MTEQTAPDTPSGVDSSDESLPPASTNQAPAPETDGTPEAAAPGPNGSRQNEDALPEWARSELASVCREAAKYRVAAKELRESLEKAKSPEEFEAASTRITELETDLHRERLARKYHLPDVLASRVTGATEQEREADAKALAEAFHTRTVGMGKGGLSPNAKQTPTDPGALAGLIPRRRR